MKEYKGQYAVEYKGFRIHGFLHKPECTISLDWRMLDTKYKSMHAAKIAITKHLKRTT